MPTTRVPDQTGRALTALDHRIESVTGHSVDQLWEHRDRGLLDAPRARLVDVHRSLVQAETSVTFYRVLLHRLSSGEFLIDEALFARIDRTVGQLKDAVAARGECEREVLAALEPVKAAARTHGPAATQEMTAPDIAALLAIAQGAKLHEHTCSPSDCRSSPPPEPASPTASFSAWTRPVSWSGTPPIPCTPGNP
ncbi:hypothetical protein ACH4UT_29220 [Streptomyces sp. NPDC020799]|uniref:hypothetical protein n=1 Tax=Streptomyces sp. NPDC020799 TaxID=3365091 RepID=UPI00379A352A